uniref:Uncharacterized protein n=1 Tax=Lutzomyia longipalpis TaxID=7200 RepID=A0A1B0CNZ1_LUTLO
MGRIGVATVWPPWEGDDISNVVDIEEELQVPLKSHPKACCGDTSKASQTEIPFTPGGKFLLQSFVVILSETPSNELPNTWHEEIQGIHEGGICVFRAHVEGLERVWPVDDEDGRTTEIREEELMALHQALFWDNWNPEALSVLLENLHGFPEGQHWELTGFPEPWEEITS